MSAVAKVADDDNLTDAVWSNADRHAADTAYLHLDGDTWSPITFGAFRDQVAAVAKGFLAAGLQPGDRVGLICRTRYEWTLIDYALWTAGCATLPIYETSSAEQVEWCLSDSGARGVVVESDEHRGIVDGGVALVLQPEPRIVDRMAEARIAVRVRRGDGRRRQIGGAGGQGGLRH